MESAQAMGADNADLLVDSVPVVTFLDGIRSRAHADSKIVYAAGCPVAAEDRSGIAAAVALARTADVVILVVGDQSGIGAFGTVGEGLDSVTCELPGVQRELVEAVAASGTPTVAVLSHGRPFVLGWMTEKVPAIVSSLFGGEEAGTAVASVLFGDVNPAGRLPIAMLTSVGAAPLPYWRTLQPSHYVDGTSTAVFPFGHGLSYTDFAYRDLAIGSPEVSTDGVVRPSSPSRTSVPVQARKSSRYTARTSSAARCAEAESWWASAASLSSPEKRSGCASTCRRACSPSGRGRGGGSSNPGCCASTSGAPPRAHRFRLASP